MTIQTIKANFGPDIYEVNTTKDKRISVRTETTKFVGPQERVPTVFYTSFKIGDPAVYDSYNLYYTGPIVKITDKTVTIHTGSYEGFSGPNAEFTHEGRRRKPDNKRLRIAEFAWRNYDFDAKEIAKKNTETRMYI